MSAAGRVLSGAAGDELCVVVLDQVVVQVHLVRFGEEGVVELEAILLEHRLVPVPFGISVSE